MLGVWPSVRCVSSVILLMFYLTIRLILRGYIVLRYTYDIHLPFAHCNCLCVVISFSNSNVLLTDACNKECGCTFEFYQPVCNNDIQYFSPCIAGCLESSTQNKVSHLIVNTIIKHPCPLKVSVSCLEAI